MTTFGAAREQAEARMPPDAVTVSPKGFSPEWEDRPLTDVCLGLRPVPPRDIEDARKAAFDCATRLYPEAHLGEPFLSKWQEHFDDMLVRTIVSRGTCDPNDVTECWDGWRSDPDELARMHLTTEGAQFIFDAWERMKIANDVNTPPADDDDVDALVDRLHAIDDLPRARAMRMRRLLAFCLSELRSLDPPTET